MERSKETELLEFRRLTAAIRKESDFLKDVILSKEEKGEENKVLDDFDNEIKNQVMGTLEHLMAYQIGGWRELVNEGNDSEAGDGAVRS